MKSLIFSIFAILIIASCETSTSPDTKPEGTRIGTWMVYDTEAEWVGSQSQSKAKGFATQATDDTVHYGQPDGFSLVLYEDSYKSDELTFHYYDSTITEEQARNVSIKIGSSNDRFDTPGSLLGRTEDDVFVATSYFEKICNDTTAVPPEEILYLSILTRDSTEADFEKTIALDVAGMDSVSQEVIQCD